jgi:chloride channel protein, CIC family
MISFFNRPGLRKYTRVVHRDLSEVYSRDLHKWLLVAPVIGVATGLVISAIAEIILNEIWPRLLHYYLGHHWSIVPGLVVGFVLTGLIMQYATPDPDEHSTEEIIHSYHKDDGRVAMRPFLPKLLAAIATVGSGGSAALEGPSIYGGGALGSWLWAKLRRIGLEARDRRIMLISGAAAGMAAVFRAPLTGLVFALEMPYKDDLAHEALLPSLIASVVSYATLAFFMGAGPLFDFAAGTSFTGIDLLWSALLGLICGLACMVFTMAFRRARAFTVKVPGPHWVKLLVGGVLTGVCGLIFVSIYKDGLIPLGANYEAVGNILQNSHSSMELIVFGVLKLAATLFSLASGGVSAMFVPLFLSGGAFGTAFAQSLVHSPSLDLYAAVGMAAFIASGYKTPLTAVVFVAEATGGHSYIIPALIGAAVAYAVSGTASASGEQRWHEAVKVQELTRLTVGEVMQKHVVTVQPSSTLKEFAEILTTQNRYAVFPVCEGHALLGTISAWVLGKIAPEDWARCTVRETLDSNSIKISREHTVREALRFLTSQGGRDMLLVTGPNDKLEGVVTRSDVLSALISPDTG